MTATPSNYFCRIDPGRIFSFLQKSKKKIVINFFTIFFDARVFSFDKQKIAIHHRWVNDENDEANAYKLILVCPGKEN